MRLREILLASASLTFLAAEADAQLPPGESAPLYVATVTCSDTSADAARVQSAATAIQAAPFGGTLNIVSGDCLLNAQITASMGANQRLIIRSDGMHGARLHWSNVASAGFAITLATVTSATWISDGPSFSIENITNISTWSTATSQTAVSVTATPTSGPALQRPSVPSVAVKNVNSISSTNSGGFAGLLALANVATLKLEDMSLWGSTGDTTAAALTLTCASTQLCTGIRVNGLRQQNGGTAIVATDYFQGIYVTDLQTVGTQQSISWTNPAGYTGADSLIVDHSQMASVLNEISTNAVSHVQILGDYLLSSHTGWNAVNITGGVGHTITGNTIVQSAAGGDARCSA
jgi:hypothetical protein